MARFDGFAVECCWIVLPLFNRVDRGPFKQRITARLADGVVVGSALVSAMAQAAAEGQSDALEAAASLVSDIRGGVDNATS